MAILFPGDRDARRRATSDNNRFSDLFRAFAARGIHVEPAVYHDDFCEEVREQLTQVDGVLVWVNPVEDGRDRSALDAMLRGAAAAGVFVSTHPEVILRLGTKEVLHRTRDVGWGCDTHRYDSIDQMMEELPLRLAAGKARVLKQHRGNGGSGIWKIQLAVETSAGGGGRGPAALPQIETAVRVRHARRGCSEEEITLGEFYARCEQYFTANDPMIDQEYQERLPEGMTRCYLVHGEVAGFGHQAVNALFPAPAGAPPTEGDYILDKVRMRPHQCRPLRTRRYWKRLSTRQAWAVKPSYPPYPIRLGRTSVMSFCPSVCAENGPAFRRMLVWRRCLLPARPRARRLRYQVIKFGTSGRLGFSAKARNAEAKKVIVSRKTSLGSVGTS